VVASEDPEADGAAPKPGGGGDGVGEGVEAGEAAPKVTGRMGTPKGMPHGDPNGDGTAPSPGTGSHVEPTAPPGGKAHAGGKRA